MHTTRSQVVRMSQGEIPPFLPTDDIPEDRNEHALHGYYFLLQKKQKKQKRKNREVNTLCAFGPYSSPYEASFIRTSARALGLLEPDGVV